VSVLPFNAPKEPNTFEFAQHETTDAFLPQNLHISPFLKSLQELSCRLATH
jgi:hypothetical protein